MLHHIDIAQTVVGGERHEADSQATGHGSYRGFVSVDFQLGNLVANLQSFGVVGIDLILLSAMLCKQVASNMTGVGFETVIREGLIDQL